MVQNDQRNRSKFAGLLRAVVLLNVVSFAHSQSQGTQLQVLENVHKEMYSTPAMKLKVLPPFFCRLDIRGTGGLAHQLLPQITGRTYGFFTPPDEEWELVKPIIVEEQLLWVNGVAGVKEYRCPLITYTPKGNLVAIVEGRKTSTGDASSKFIVSKRSTDLGYEWSEESFIYDDGLVVDGDNLGAILVDDETATIFLFFTLCPHHVNCSVSSMMYTTSVDDGITWEKAVNLSAIIQGEGHSFAFGPGRGIQLKHGKHKGRLLACGHSGSVVQCIYSDDHGKSWTYGLSLPSLPRSHLKKGDFAPNENQPEELPDGSVMLNIRNQYKYHCNCRIIGISTDGGETLPLANVRLDSTLIDPVVSANILMYEGVLFFSNPASETVRMNMTLRWSYNNGTTWIGALPIWSKASGYSCMTAQPRYNWDLKNRKYIYLLFEKGLLSSTETVSLVKISIDGSM